MILDNFESAIVSKYVLKNYGFSSFSKTIVQIKQIQITTTLTIREIHVSTSMKVHNEKQRLASHIVPKDRKKLEHPEYSSGCPYLSEWPLYFSSSQCHRWFSR